MNPWRSAHRRFGMLVHTFFLSWVLYSHPALAQFASLVVSPIPVKGGNPSSGAVFRSILNPNGPSFDVSLSSSNTEVATVPLSVTIPANTAGANFTITTFPVESTTEVTITGMSGGTTRQDILTVLPYFLTDLEVVPASLLTPGTTTITLSIDAPAPAGGLTVTGWLSTPSSGFTLNVPIPGGGTQGSLVINRTDMYYTRYTVRFTLGGVQMNRELEAIPPLDKFVSINVEPSSLYGGHPATGTVRINSLAPIGGVTVELTSAAPEIVVVPHFVHIEEGTVETSFPIQSSPVLTCVNVPLSATADFALNEGMGSVYVLPSERLTDDPLDFSWSRRHKNTSGGNQLWADGSNVFFSDGISTHRIQSGSIEVPELDNVEDTVFGLGSGAAPGEVIGVWRRGQEYAWLWTNTSAGPVLLSATNPLDSNLKGNPERVAIADGCVFMDIQSASGGVNYQYVFKVDPGTGIAEQISGDAEALPFISTKIASSQCQAAWAVGDGTTSILYFYDGMDLVPIDTGGPFGIDEPQMKNGRIVYLKEIEGVQQVFLYDSTIPDPTPEQLTFDPTGTANTSAQTDGGHVAWVHWPMGSPVTKGGGMPSDIILRGGYKFTEDATPKPIFHLDQGQMMWAYDFDVNEFDYFDGRVRRIICTDGDNYTFERPWLADGFLSWLGDVFIDVIPTKGSEIFRQVYRTTLVPPIVDQKPFPPFVLEATPAAGRVFLSWDQVLGVNAYNVYYAREGGITKENYLSLEGGDRIQSVSEPYAVSGLIDGATYYFVVTAVENGTEGYESVEASARPLPDCNSNGVDDTLDIQFGIETDDNLNGIPDVCEATPTPSETPTFEGPTLTGTPTSTITPGGPTLTPTPTTTCVIAVEDLDLDGSQRIDAPDLLRLLIATRSGQSGTDFDCDAQTGPGDLFELARYWETDLTP